MNRRLRFRLLHRFGRVLVVTQRDSARLAVRASKASPKRLGLLASPLCSGCPLRNLSALRVDVANDGRTVDAGHDDGSLSLRGRFLLYEFDAKCIGKININEFSTYVAVDRQIAREAVQRLSAGKVKGKKIKVRLMQE